MERLVVLPPVKDRVRTALLNLADFRDISTEQLRQMARQLPGGKRAYLPDRETAIVLLLRTHLVDLSDGDSQPSLADVTILGSSELR